MNLFLDTNAVVKLYHDVLGTENLLKFLNSYSDNLIITISDLTIIEFHSTFLKRVRTTEIALPLVNKISKDFDADITMFNVIEVNLAVMDLAIKLLDFIASKKGLRTLDAIQLSVAIFSHQFFPINYFVGSDKKLLNVTKEYFAIFNPEL